MNIFVFKRADESYFADYSQAHANAQGSVIQIYRIDTAQQAQELIDNPGKYATERVRALAERALLELEEPLFQPPKEVHKRGVFGRIKWALTGK